MAHRPEQTIAFRKAGTNDAEAIAALHLLVRRVSMPYVPELHTLEETVAYFRNAIGANTIIVAEASANMIGYCAFRPEWIDHPKRPSAALGFSEERCGADDGARRAPAAS